MKNLDRRSFIKTSLLTSASFGLLPAITGCTTRKAGAPSTVHLRAHGANEDIRVAVVGFNGRGADHIRSFRQITGVRLAALCDVDCDVLDKEVKKAKDQGQPVQGYTDIRKLLENPDIDVISIASPNHWHALSAIWALQAGKDVYVEKPVSHNVWEGRQIVEAALKYGRIVQAGMQSRSSEGIRPGIAWLREGHLGKIIRARALCYKRRPSIGKVNGPQPIPPSIDYDLWCGPAPKEPLMRKRLHYDWHWVWPTGNGDLGNQGVHQMDLARWALGEPELAPRTFSIGGRLGYEDDGTTPNTLVVFHDYKAAPLIFEVRGLPSAADSTNMDSYRGSSIGVVIDCEGGYLVIPKESTAIAFDKNGKEIKTFEGSVRHYENFINVVRSRRPTDLNADVLDGHLSSALCHTGNISYRLGTQQPPEEIREGIKGNSEAVETWSRMEEHLAANGVDLNKTKASLGVFLKMAPKIERFIGNHKANQLLTRNYREPFVVPERV